MWPIRLLCILGQIPPLCIFHGTFLFISCSWWHIGHYGCLWYWRFISQPSWVDPWMGMGSCPEYSLATLMLSLPCHLEVFWISKWGSTWQQNRMVANYYNLIPYILSFLCIDLFLTSSILWIVKMSILRAILERLLWMGPSICYPEAYQELWAS